MNEKWNTECLQHSWMISDDKDEFFAPVYSQKFVALMGNSGL